MYRRIVFAAAQGTSFQEAGEVLQELGELKLLPKRIWRAAQRIGAERVEECRTGAAKYEQLYVYAGAMAGRAANEGWSHYRDWAQWLWGGHQGMHEIEDRHVVREVFSLSVWSWVWIGGVVVRRVRCRASVPSRRESSRFRWMAGES